MTSAAADEHLEDVVSCSTTVLAAPAVSRDVARAHDMKNCLSVILAITWLMERDTGAKLPERLQRLRTSVEALRDLVLRSDLTEAECSRPARAAFCSHQMALAVMDRAHERATRAGVRLHLVAEAGEASGDEPALREALFNLVTNAIDATPAGGTVRVHLRDTPQGDQHWEVEDTGCGIPRERMPMIGRAFRTTKTGGSGIGLALVQAVVTRHGGQLRIESREGHGSTFSVILPRR